MGRRVSHMYVLYIYILSSIIGSSVEKKEYKETSDATVRNVLMFELKNEMTTKMIIWA